MNHIIVAHDQNRAIGNNNELLWPGAMRADMRRFKRMTTGNAVIMGRLTFDSLRRPLPDRKNIVLSRQHDLVIPGCTVAHSIEEAFEVAQSEEETFVIGGEKIYRLAMPHVDSLHVTKVDTVAEEADAFFVEIDPAEWQLVEQEHYPADADNQFDYTFQHYLRAQ